MFYVAQKCIKDKSSQQQTVGSSLWGCIYSICVVFHKSFEICIVQNLLLLFCNNCSITFIWTNNLIAVACVVCKFYPSCWTFVLVEARPYVFVLNNHCCCFTVQSSNILWDLRPHSASSLFYYFPNLVGYQLSF